VSPYGNALLGPYGASGGNQHENLSGSFGGNPQPQHSNSSASYNNAPPPQNAGAPVCRFFAAGHCRDGARCSYAHTQSTGGAGMSSVSSGGRPEPGGIFELAPRNDPNLRIDVDGGGTQAGATMIVWSKNGKDNQRFILEAHRGDAFFLSPKHSPGVALACHGHGRQVALAAKQQAQAWRIVMNELTGFCTIVEAQSGMVMQLPAAVQRGQPLVCAPVSGDLGQQFKINRVGTYFAPTGNGI
jgi:hypothetical protein